MLTESEARAGSKGCKGSSPFPSSISHIVVIQVTLGNATLQLRPFV